VSPTGTLAACSHRSGPTAEVEQRFGAWLSVGFERKEYVVKMLSRALMLGLVCLALTLPSWRDAVAQPSFEFGLKAGASAAKLTGDDTKAYEFQVDADNFEKGNMSDMKLGLVGGGYAIMHVNDRFGVRLEALYFQKGGKGSAEGEDEGVPYTADMTFKLDYFEIPILAVATFPAGPSGTFDIFAGPALGINLSGKQKTEWTAGGLSGTDEEDIEDIKSTDFGGVVGVGFTYALSTVNLFADARWEMGFTSIVDDPEAEDEVDIKNMGFAFMVGVGFPLGGTAATP